MADLKRFGKGVTGALAQAKQLAAAEREANLQRMLEPSKIKQRLYHGTTATEGGKGQEAIRRIKPSKEGALGSGVYLTPNAAHASGYSGIPNDEAIAAMASDPYAKKMADQFMADRMTGTVREGQEGGNMLPVYAQLKNPLILEGKGDPMVEALVKLGMDEDKAANMVERAYEQKGYIGKQVETRARAAGYDGLMQYRDGDLSEVVSYNPNAVKSATGNEGTYDILNPDLSKADGGKITRGVMGALKKATDMAKANKAPQAEAMRLAQQRAALPKEKGGLGLAKDNTPEQRANAMGIKTDAYHGSKQDITGAFRPGYDDNLAFVTKSPEFANKWIGKGKYNQRAGEQAQQEVKSAEDAYREIRSRNMNYDDALERLKGDEFNNEYDRRSALARAEAEQEFGTPGNADKIHSTVYPLKVEANNTFNPETDMDVMAEFFEKNEIPPKLQELYAGGNYMMYETKPVVEFLKSKGYDSMRLRESTGDDYPTIAVFNPETTRSRFAAFDPFRKDAATAAAMGVLAPDLLAKETEEHKAKGGILHMADAGKVVGKVTGALTKAKEMAKANKASQASSSGRLSDKDKAALRALDMGVPGEDFADPLNPKDVMRMSEALGNAGAEGKFLNLTQADRSRVFGPNKGGTGFSGLQLTSLPHKEARSTWGVGKPSHATRLINANDPDTLWSTFIGSPTQHMSNPVTVQRMYEAHRNANPSADLVGKMNTQLNNAIHPKTKKPIFPEGIDISDPSSLAKAQTFDQRKAIAQAMTIGGEKKGERATQEAFKVIKEETDPLLADAPTYAVGNRLFTIDSKTGIYRPDLNEAFPYQVTGDDLGLLFDPAPIELAAPTFVKRFEGRKNKLDKPQPMGHKDLTATTPREFVDEKYLTNLQKEGHKKGGEVSDKGNMSMKLADLRLRAMVDERMGMAQGGRVSIFDAPAKRMSKGGSSDEPTAKEIAVQLGKMAVDQGKEELGSFKKPRAATDIANRGILAPALGLPVDLMNMGLMGVDTVSQAIGKPTRLSSERPMGGSEHLKELMNKYGVTSGEDRPLTETMLSLFSPTGMVKGSMSATKGAAKAADAMRKPMSGLGAMREKVN